MFVFKYREATQTRWLNGRASLKTAERYLAFVMDMIREFAGEC